MGAKLQQDCTLCGPRNAVKQPQPLHRLVPRARIALLQGWLILSGLSEASKTFLHGEEITRRLQVG